MPHSGALAASKAAGTLARQGVPPDSANTRHGGPEAQAEAMRLMVEGWNISTVAGRLRVNRHTVAEWRDAPEGQRILAEARKARESAFLDAAQDARRVLRESAVHAAQVLRDNLHAPRATSRTRAAQEILDRVGVPRTERIEAVTISLVDMKLYTQEELDTLEQLQARATKATG